jgi:hypothetical protein
VILVRDNYVSYAKSPLEHSRQIISMVSSGRENFIRNVLWRGVGWKNSKRI